MLNVALYLLTLAPLFLQTVAGTFVQSTSALNKNSTGSVELELDDGKPLPNFPNNKYPFPSFEHATNPHNGTRTGLQPAAVQPVPIKGVHQFSRNWNGFDTTTPFDTTATLPTKVSVVSGREQSDDEEGLGHYGIGPECKCLLDCADERKFNADVKMDVMGSISSGKVNGNKSETCLNLELECRNHLDVEKKDENQKLVNETKTILSIGEDVCTFDLTSENPKNVNFGLDEKIINRDFDFKISSVDEDLPADLNEYQKYGNSIDCVESTCSGVGTCETIASVAMICNYASETVQINHDIKNKDTTNPKILQTNGSLQTNLSRTNSRRKTNSTLNETGSDLLLKFNRDMLRSLNGTNDDTNCTRPKERRPFRSNGKPNKSFSGVDAAAQRASIEHYLKNLKFRFVESEVFKCIKMTLGLFGMGCFVLVMCFIIPWVDLNIHSLLVYRRWYWFSIRERRRWWKKKFEKKPSFKIGRSYGHRFKALLPVKWVLSLFIAASELGVGADAYAKMPDGCKGKGWSDRSCYPKKAVDELIALNADGSGIHPTYGPMKDWDMSLVTDMNWLFRLKTTMNANLSSWNVSSVTNMQAST